MDIAELIVVAVAGAVLGGSAVLAFKLIGPKTRVSRPNLLLRVVMLAIFPALAVSRYHPLTDWVNIKLGLQSAATVTVRLPGRSR